MAPRPDLSHKLNADPALEPITIFPENPRPLCAEKLNSRKAHSDDETTVK